MLLKPLYKSLFGKDPDAVTPDMDIDLSSVSVDVLESILLHVDKKSLIHCRLVCRKWKDLLDSRSFWLSKEETDGDHYLKDLIDSSSICPHNYAKLSILQPYNRNLLTDSNPDPKLHQEHKKHADPRWHFDNGGNGWRYEEPVVFYHDSFDPEFKEMFSFALATSYHLCSKVMDLDLSKLGIDAEILDNHRPPIVFTEYVSNRSDCGSFYRMYMKFYDSDDVLLASETQEIRFDQWELQKWNKMEVTLKSYPRGCRILRVYSSGRDTQFWAGHYGVKIAGSQLVVTLDSTPPSIAPPVAGDPRTFPIE